MTRAPRFDGLASKSMGASASARGSSKKCDTTERLLRAALWRSGLRFRKHSRLLPGRPDIVFFGARVAVFVDGDFWHGRDWSSRRKMLIRGHNARYWVAKIERNMLRDREQEAILARTGWLVMRFWETDVKAAPDNAAAAVQAAVLRRRAAPRSPRYE